MSSRIWLSGILCLFLLQPVSNASVQLGIDSLASRKFAGLEGKRVGLVTNPSGVNAAGRRTRDILHAAPQVRLAALFAPEHGIDGDIPAGEYVATRTDARTGVTIYSLYGTTRKPTPEMLRGLDVILYDLQDVGARSYTFISTLGLVMEAAAEAGIEVWVLDRPNPLGGERIEGGGVDSSIRSFVGQYDIPYVYGMTVGEVALWINRNYLVRPCRLTVYRMKGWRRTMSWADTGLRWVPTSPNIPHASSAYGYTATGLLGDLGITNGANVHSHPFEVIAVENLDPAEFCRRMNACGISGVRFEPLRFHPTSGRFRHVAFHGARLHIDPRARASLLQINFHALDVLRELHNNRNYFQTTKPEALALFDKINGGTANRRAWLAGRDARAIAATWKAFEDRWREAREPYLLYD